MKKIKNLAIILLMTTIIMILNVKVEAKTGIINVDTVRLRAEASTDSDIVEQLDIDDKVEILEEKDGWYKVSITKGGKKLTGYVSAKLVKVDGSSEEKEVKQVESEKTATTQEEPKQEATQEQPAEKVEEPKVEEPEKVEEQPQEVKQEETNTISIVENQEIAIKQKISLKLLPTINSLEKSEILSGNVKVVEIINNWCKVENDVESGWVRKNILQKSVSNIEATPTEQVPAAPTEETPVQEPEKTENAETQVPEKKEEVVEEKVIKTGYVSVNSLKVRKEASTSSEDIDALSKNDEVQILKELDGWYKIKLGKDKIGYVSSKYISDKKVVETTSRGTSEQRVDSVTEIENTTKEPAPAPANTDTAKANDVVSYAKQYVGYKYVAGGASPSTGFDCSGFTSYVYKQYGVSLNRTSRDQVKNGTAVDKSNLQPGDLLLFKGSSGDGIGHVGIYIGGGEFIHASNPKGGVKITELDSSYYSTRYVAARRVL